MATCMGKPSVWMYLKDKSIALVAALLGFGIGLDDK